MANSDKSRLPMPTARAVVRRTQDQLLTQRTGRRVAGFVDDALGDRTSRRRRFELLDMGAEADVRRWQIVHNDSERYDVVSARYTTVRSGEDNVEYRCLLMYIEIGAELPLYKSVDELRADDMARARHTSGDAAEVEPDFSDLGAEE